RILAGYYSPDESFDIYKCLPQEYCPGGTPGQCAGGRIGLPCSKCPPGLSWDNGACETCGALSVPGWTVTPLMGAIGVPLLYFMLNGQGTAKASTMLATTCAMAMTISMLQNLGIVGLISFKWPDELAWLFNSLSIFNFDLSALGFSCLSDNLVLEYATSTIALPCGLVWLAFCGLVSQFLPRKWRFEKAKLVNTMGQMVQVTFTIYSKIALTPIMCYSNPNGRMAMLKHNGVFCFDSPEHAPMFLMGLALVTGMITFYSTAIHATIWAPKAAQSGNAAFLQSTRFLLFRFRVDYWWYGTFVLPRGWLLSMAIVVAADSPYMQMLMIITIMLIYLVVQLITWPWKLPALNAFDGTISACLLLMMAILGAFAPAVTEDLRQVLTQAAMGIVGFLNSVIFVMMLVTGVAVVKIHAMGGASESSWLALGQVPNTQFLAEKVAMLAEALEELEDEDIKAVLDKLSVYDLRMIQGVITAFGSELGHSELLLDRRVTVVSRFSNRGAARDGEMRTSW
ncbi:unnamed protein product, partial [Effrenium voratum]